MGVYVQYGCGLCCPEGWLNFDASPRLKFENAAISGWWMMATGQRLFPRSVRFGDIVRGLPVKAQSCDGVYCSHVLEHLDRTSMVKALGNTFDILKPGGVFRLVVPDLSWRARDFLENQKNGAPDAADKFMRSTYLGVEAPTTGTLARLRSSFGNSAHRWMYDYGLMAELLDQAGFVAIRRCKFGDAEDPMFAEVEEKDRFYDDGHEELAIEARRPANPDLGQADD